MTYVECGLVFRDPPPRGSSAGWGLQQRRRLGVSQAGKHASAPSRQVYLERDTTMGAAIPTNWGACL